MIVDFRAEAMLVRRSALGSPRYQARAVLYFAALIGVKNICHFYL